MKRKRKTPYYRVLVRFADGACYHKGNTSSPLTYLKNWIRAGGAPGVVRQPHLEPWRGKEVVFIPDKIQYPVES